MREQKISEVGLSTRTTNCLGRCGISTLGELADFIDYTPEFFMKIRNLGYNSQVENLDLLQEQGITLHVLFENDTEKRKLILLNGGRKAPYPENLVRKIGLLLFFDCQTYTPLSVDKLLALENAIGTLPVEAQRLIRKKYKEGLSTAEIATQSKMSERSVEINLNRIIYELRIKLVRLKMIGENDNEYVGGK